ncbi:ATP-binding protein [Pusillimonas sp. TS35]|nr:ATP-binding protein [Pusillimonas sp. TS35]
MRAAFSGSLRARLLAGTLAWILASVALAGWGLADLFRQHVMRQMQSELVLHLNQLTAAFNVGDTGNAIISSSLSDPRFERPLSGLYWQVDELGRNTLLDSGVLHSRSLWDEVLALPAASAARAADIGVPGMPRDRVYEFAGPDGEPLLVLARTVNPPESPSAYRLIVAADMATVAEPVGRFTTMMWLALGVLAAGLTLAAVLQVVVGLRPLARLRKRLADVHEGRAARVEGGLPSEVQPLVDELNAVLAANEEIVERARTQAGNLAHAVKTPLSVLANAASCENSAFGKLVAEQTALAQRQVAHHLSRARAAAAVRNPSVRTHVEAPLQALARVLRKLYVERQLDIELAPVPEGAMFRGEEQDLHEMLGNVMENACKWARSRVAVNVGLDGHELYITVDDDGPGLPPEQYDAIFERGVRMDERRPGHGLGLAIVRDLAGVYGGGVSAAKSPLGGLRVHLRLPAAGRMPG